MAQYQTSPQFTDDETRVPRAEVLFQGPSALMGRCQNRGDGSKGQKEDDEIKERRGNKGDKGWKTREKRSHGKEQEEDKSEVEAWTDKETRRGWGKGSGSWRETSAHPRDDAFTTQPWESWSCWLTGAFFISLSPPDFLNPANGI